MASKRSPRSGHITGSVIRTADGTTGADRCLRFPRVSGTTRGDCRKRNTDTTEMARPTSACEHIQRCLSGCLVCDGEPQASNQNRQSHRAGELHPLRHSGTRNWSSPPDSCVRQPVRLHWRQRNGAFLRVARQTVPTVRCRNPNQIPSQRDEQGQPQACAIVRY